MQALSSLAERVRVSHAVSTLHSHHCSCPGAASDKVAALERAGVHVTDSPAKIGSEMLKVCQKLLTV